ALHTFPHGGRYRLYAEYTPPGSNQRVEFFDAEVQGPARPQPPRLEAPLELRAGEDVELTFNLGSIAGLQPYLGAWAHIAIAGESLTSFIHAHPIAERVHTHAAEALGPAPDAIRVVTSFPSAGVYKVWLQLQVAGKVQTLPFVMRAAAPFNRGGSA